MYCSPAAGRLKQSGTFANFSFKKCGSLVYMTITKEIFPTSRYLSTVPLSLLLYCPITFLLLLRQGSLAPSFFFLLKNVSCISLLNDRRWDAEQLTSENSPTHYTWGTTDMQKCVCGSSLVRRSVYWMSCPLCHLSFSNVMKATIHSWKVVQVKYCCCCGNLVCENLTILIFHHFFSM